MTAKLHKYTPEIILFFYVVLFLLVKNPADPFDRVLISDGKGYYAYLTAIFIYDDLDYNFIEDYEAKYYGHDKIKDFRYKFDGEIVNTYFPGVAFLMLPFFLIAHFLSMIFGFPADGYSIIYQYSIGLGALFYLWIGLQLLRKLLESFHFSIRQVSFILILIALGTNINYYVLKEGAMSHIYSFAAISGLLLLVRQASKNFRKSSIISAALFFGLIVIIRPTNALLILLVPFVAGSKEAFFNLIKNIFTKPKTMILVLIASAFFPFMMMFLWYLQSGSWIVYSYGEHGFDFTNPYFFQILFSFDKGWFIYTPVALLALCGFFRLFRNNKFQFWWALIFMLAFVYVQSSWYCWTFTSNFGNRTFIDIYPLIAILLGFFLILLNKQKILKNLFVTVFLLLLVLNNLQFYQHYKYIYPPGTIDFAIYKDSFTQLIPTARVRVPEENVLSKETFKNDFEDDYGWLNYGSVTDTLAFAGKYVSQPGLVNDYSIGLLVDAKPLIKSEFVWVKVSAKVFSNQNQTRGQLVVQLENKNQFYFYKPFYLKEYIVQNKWTLMEFRCTLPRLRAVDDQLRVFFFNTNKNDLLLVDDLKVEVISFSADPEDK